MLDLLVKTNEYDIQRLYDWFFANPTQDYVSDDGFHEFCRYFKENEPYEKYEPNVDNITYYLDVKDNTWEYLDIYKHKLILNVLKEDNVVIFWDDFSFGLPEDELFQASLVYPIFKYIHSTEEIRQLYEISQSLAPRYESEI